jgi:hypothetical protein
MLDKKRRCFQGVASFALLVSEAIWTHEGKIVDGRNRYNACVALKIKPTYREWDGNGSLAAFVVSLNLHRRHLNESQRAMVAEALSTMTEGRPKTASIDAVSQDEAAKLLNVSRKSVQRAREVRKKGTPETIAAVESGALPVSVATQHIAAVSRIALRTASGMDFAIWTSTAMVRADCFVLAAVSLVNVAADSALTLFPCDLFEPKACDLPLVVCGYFASYKPLRLPNCSLRSSAY